METLMTGTYPRTEAVRAHITERCPDCGATDNLTIRYYRVGGMGWAGHCEPVVECEDKDLCWLRQTIHEDYPDQDKYTLMNEGYTR